MTHKLLIIVATTREGRSGRALGNWMADYAREHSDFEVEIADLAEIDLPFLDERNHPMLGKYEKDHTLAWAKTVQAADAFIIVTAEYNRSFPAPLKNALDFLFNEWRDKPVGFLCYGGGAGTGAMLGLLPTLYALSMFPVRESMTVPNAAQYVQADGHVELPENIAAGASPMLRRLQDLSDRLRPKAD